MFGIKKSITNRRVLGVLGGIANRFQINPQILRIVYLLGCLFSFGGLVICYFILALILPNEDINQYVSPGGRKIHDAKKVK